MPMIEDAYEFGTTYATRGCFGNYTERLKCLQNARATAASFVTKFFHDYPDYRYNKANADVAFTFRARVHKGKDVVPETLTDMSLSIIINGYTLTNEDIKVCKC